MKILVVPLTTRVGGRTGANPAEPRAESRPVHQGRPRWCRGTGLPPNTFAPRDSHSDHGRSPANSRRSHRLAPRMHSRRLWPTIARLRQAGGMSRLRQEEKISPSSTPSLTLHPPLPLRLPHYEISDHLL